MSPTPEKTSSLTPHHVSLHSNCNSDTVLHDNSIVISGMSGMYPNANNNMELSDILYNKQNPMSHPGSRWDLKHPELSSYVGKAPNVDRFDAQFFGVHYRLGNHMDPMSRKLLEHTFQAMYDAGLNPGHFSGKKVAVIIGSSFSDTEKDEFINLTSEVGSGIMGSNKSMQANRISFWLNTKGPSLSVDDGDCSSTTALQEACSAIHRGDCEAAIVGGSNLCLHPHSIIHHGRIAMISKDGKTKSFSENADGYVLSDAISVIVLQKAEDALRNYAQVVHVKNKYVPVMKDHTGPKYGYYRDVETTAKFIKDFYDEAQVSPQAVEYVECYGTGVPYADKSELESIAEVYCKDRLDTLLVGSVASNIGVTVAPNGIVGITKVLLGYHKGELAANVNCDQPQKGVLALHDGRMRIITEHETFRRRYTAINGMSMSGINSHVLLYGHYKPKDLSRYNTSIPYIVTLSGRQEENIHNIFSKLRSRPTDAEEIALLHNIHSKNISGHLGRGYIILASDAKTQKTISLVEKSNYFNDAKRPLWYVYSGMGSQWAGMGAQLMRIPIFASAIERCHQVLSPKGLDIVDIICSTNKTTFDNILHSFVGIAAVQIGLTDILREMGLIPDGIIGHSVGELGCAYADGTLTTEEMILAAYSRGRVSLETSLIRGSMAAVGLGYNQIRAICPPEVDVACHNSSTSCTISGPSGVMKHFVADLSAQGIFAKEVPCSNIAYHSRYIAGAGPNLLKYLKEVIKNPKVRSERWISTSVPQDKWNEPSARYCSAEYHTNNLLNPVLFEETCRLIPKNAVLVEVAPHGLLQAILKRSMPIDCRHIPLTRRGYPDNVVHLLKAIGNIYMEGYALNIQGLYPKVEFPVSTETPMLSHLVEWNHSEIWNVTSFNVQNKKTASICKFVMSIHDNEHKYLKGHVISKKMCYPFAASLVNIWDMFAMNTQVTKRKLSINFEDVHLYAQPLLFYQKPLRLNVSLHKGTGRFEVTTEYSRVISGFIVDKKTSNVDTIRDDVTGSSNMELTSKDIYQLLNDRGYNYSDHFQTIQCCNLSLNKASLVWSNNWVTFIDGMLQLNMLQQTYDDILMPIYVKNISIDVEEHLNSHIYHLNGKNVMDVEINHNITRCGGVVLEHIRYRHLPPMRQNLQNLEFSIVPSEVGNIYKTKYQHHDIPNVITLESAQVGNIDSLKWVQTCYVHNSNVTITVHFAGVNMLDVRRATGTCSYIDNSYVMEYSGVTDSGDRVMGLWCGVGVTSHVTTSHPELMWPVPPQWSLEDAATVPYAYAYALYALVIKGHIEPGMNILIHDGASDVGQAAIYIAFSYKCNVYTTVYDSTQKMFLKRTFPLLKDDHIGSICDVSFADDVMLVTDGKGCDIVVSCVKGYLKDASIKCCCFGGVLIDTVQIQDKEDYEYGMYHMTRSRSYVTIDISSIFTQNNRTDMELLQLLLCDGITSGRVVPLARVTYAPCDVTRAVTLVHNELHTGRVLLRMREHVPIHTHRIICDPEQCQVMFWNNEVFGVHLAEKLIRQGAKKLFISSTKLSQYLLFKIRCWKKRGVKVNVSSEQLTKDLFRTKVLNEALNLGTIQNKLDSTSRLLCQQLKYFVIVSTINNLGKNVCLHRLKCKHPATCLDLSNCNLKDLSGPDVADAVDRALCSEHATLVAQTKQIKQIALFDRVIALADIKIAQETGIDVTLQELGLSDEKLSSISALLNVVYNISLDMCQVSKLTLQRLYEMDIETREVCPCDVTALSPYIKNSYCDELLATLDIVVLSTLTHQVISQEYDFDIEDQYLCIIPGIEGHHERFRLMCERLKLPAIVLQPGLDHPHETAKETAQRYAQILYKKTKMQDKFYILGYECGIIIALELAAIFEDNGLTGTVFCLGYLPNELQLELQTQLSVFDTDEKLEDAVIEHVCKLISVDGEGEAWGGVVRDGNTWTQKVEASIRCMTGRVAHSAQFVRALLEAARARLMRARRPAPAPRALRSRVIVLRAATGRSYEAPLQSMILHQLQFPLSCVTMDMQCAALINQYLDGHILKQFEDKNLCETYLIAK